jgi:hypothetical protein
MGPSEKPLSANRRLVFAMTIAAVTSAAVRLLRGNIDAGVLVQLVLSFVAVIAAGVPFADDGPRVTRAIRSLSLCAFAIALLAAPYARIQLFAPFLAATLLVFGAWVGYERFGRRMLGSLALLVPIGVWAAFAVRTSLEHRRVGHLGPEDVASVNLVAPDGTKKELRGAGEVARVTTRFARMQAWHPKDDAMKEIWKGEMTLANGTREPIAIGHSDHGRATTWIVIGGRDYYVDDPYDDVTTELLR